MPGYPMQAGFDQSSLMSDPKLKQQETMNQGNMVSAPYFQANKMAAEKTNPMNAISQETPVGDRVDDFLNRMGKQMFMDNDFPAVMANGGGKTFLSGFDKGMNKYSQAGTDIDDFQVEREYEQELGKPMMETVRFRK